MWQVGAIVGSAIAALKAEKFGRRDAMALWTCMYALAGCACIVLSKPCHMFELLIVGRFVCGIAFANHIVSFGIYVTECAPDNVR